MKRKRLIGLVITLLLVITACGKYENLNMSSANSYVSTLISETIEISSMEEMTKPYDFVNDNKPQFETDELKPTVFEHYEKLDRLGRCGAATACIGLELMPTEERGPIGQVKPSGWHTVKYDFVDGKYLYNRCHLIGYQLSGENANEKNLITGTRYMNVEGMLPFENMVADYVKSTNNHVFYRVTPIFDKDNLIATGVQMEAFSIEDHGQGVCFNVFVYNIQPGVEIDYQTGESWLVENVQEKDSSGTFADKENSDIYILNSNTMKYHVPECESVSDIKPKNKKEYTGSEQELLNMGYAPCGRCIQGS